MTVGPACDAVRSGQPRVRSVCRPPPTTKASRISRGVPTEGRTEDGTLDVDDSVEGGATPGGGGSEWRSRGRRERDMSAQSKYKCQHLPDVLPESCKATSKFCDKENPMWAKLGLTNIPGLHNPATT